MRRGVLLVGVPLLAVLAFLVLATPGNAAVTGPCTGTINGDEIHGTVTVPENGTVAWKFTTTDGSFVESWAIELIFLGQSIPVDVGEDEEPDKTSKGDVADVNSYAKYGVGIYELTGSVVTEAGGVCKGTVEVIVQGNPLTTAMGAAGAGATVLGAGGAAAASAGSAKAAAAAALKP